MPMVNEAIFLVAPTLLTYLENVERQNFSEGSVVCGPQPGRGFRVKQQFRDGNTSGEKGFVYITN